jgi:hypothetical protein
MLPQILERGSRVAASLSERSNARINRSARAWMARSLEKGLAFRSKPSIGVDIGGPHNLAD